MSADFFAAKGLLAARPRRRSASSAASPPRRVPFLHPGRTASVLAGETRIGFIGELHPLVAASWDLERAAVWALDLGLAASWAPAVRALRAVRGVPGGARGPRRRRRRQRQRRARSSPSCARPAAQRSRASRSSTSTAATQVGGGARVAGAPPRVPRLRPHADRRGGARRARARSPPRSPSGWAGELRA